MYVCSMNIFLYILHVYFNHVVGQTIYFWAAFKTYIYLSQFKRAEDTKGRISTLNSESDRQNHEEKGKQ